MYICFKKDLSSCELYISGVCFGVEEGRVRVKFIDIFTSNYLLVPVKDFYLALSWFELNYNSNKYTDAQAIAYALGYDNPHKYNKRLLYKTSVRNLVNGK
jgi:hypothetical protein